MGKRYFCDYCDKSFADNPVNRKLHLTGQVHLRNKKAHYDAVKDEREILEEDVHKKPCRSFMATGECRFGDRCQYSHLTSEDKARMSRRIMQKQKKAEEREKQRKQTLADLSGVLDKWVESRNERKKKKEAANDSLKEEDEEADSDSGKKEQEVCHSIPDYHLAQCLKAFPSLPPSLIPPSKEDILNADYAEWG